MNKLKEIEERWEAAHPGPWGWRGNAKHSFHLVTLHSGQIYVMGFRRMGMGGAQPEFQPGKRGVVPARDICVYEVNRNATDINDPSLYRHDIIGFRAPDAVAIAAAPSDVEYLLGEVKRLREIIEHSKNKDL